MGRVLTRSQDVGQTAIQNGHQTLDDILTPVLRLAVDQAAQLRDRDAYTNLVQPSGQIGNRTNVSLSHHNPDAPDQCLFW